jgi:hypothetical protein
MLYCVRIDGDPVHSSLVLPEYLLELLIAKRSVGIETGYGLDGRSSIPGKGNFSLFSTASRQALEPPSLLYNGNQGLFLWG